MSALPILFLTVATTPSFDPILWLDLEGAIRVKGQQANMKVRPGTSAVQVPGGTGWEFRDGRAGFILSDSQQFALVGSFTISAWLKPSTYARPGGGAQIVFRGDERDSLDPYTLVIHPDGHIRFGIMNERGEGVNVGAPLPLGSWTHVMASFDRRSGELALWMNGLISSALKTEIEPFSHLDPNQSPGVGIGNTQWDKGRHNQPFSGQIADLRIYDRLMTPARIGLNRSPWIQPEMDGAGVEALRH